MRNQLDESVIVNKHTAVGSACEQLEITAFIVQRDSEKIRAQAKRLEIEIHDGKCGACGIAVVVAESSLIGRKVSEVYLICSPCRKAQEKAGTAGEKTITKESAQEYLKIYLNGATK